MLTPSIGVAMRRLPSPTLCLLAALVLVSAQTPRAPAKRTAAAAQAGGGGRLAGSPKPKGGAPAARGRSSPPAVLAENAKACIFEFPGSTKLYYALQARPGGAERAWEADARRQDVASPGGYYQVSQPVGAVTYSFWFQFCSNMEFSRAEPNRPGVSIASSH